MTIRNLDDSVKKSLRLRAAKNGRSMEEEARHLLRQGLASDRPATGLGSRIAERFQSAGGIDLPIPDRSAPRRAPALGSAAKSR